MYEVLEILSSIRGGAKDVIDVTFVQLWLSSLIFFKHFILDVTNKQARDMKVSVVKQVNGGTAPRQREERRLIFKLKTLAPSGMNMEFKFI